MNSNVDTIYSREGARKNSYPDDDRRSRITNFSHADWVQTCPLNCLGVQKTDESSADCIFPIFLEEA